MLGISQEEMIEKVVDAMSDKILAAPDDDMDNTHYRNTIIEKLDMVIAERIESEVRKNFDRHVTPRIEEMIADMTFTKTNNWGERAGKTLTLREFLIEKAEAYMGEDVNAQGHSKSQCRGHSFYGAGNRLSVMIDNHLEAEFKRVVDDIYQIANKGFEDGIKAEMTRAIEDVSKRMQVSITKARK